MKGLLDLVRPAHLGGSPRDYGLIAGWPIECSLGLRRCARPVALERRWVPMSDSSRQPGQPATRLTVAPG